MNIRIFIFIILNLVFIRGFSQYEFIENKGQWNENVKYRVGLKDGAIFLEENCLTFNFISINNEEEFSIDFNDPHGYEQGAKHKGHAYKVHFLNSKTPEFSEEIPANDYCNYYIGNESSKWKSNVKKYGKIKYNDIYNGIDLIYYNNNEELKYDFIVHPGGNTKDILLEYEGVEFLFLDKGDLVIGTSVNLVKELKPLAYQLINGDTVKVECNYSLKGNKLSFSFPRSFDKSKDLIIDPSLVFSTFTGSLGDNWGFTATWDYSENVYSAGIVFAVGYPVSVGAYQTNFAGGSDIGIIKFNENGTERLFATYLGGSGHEMPHSLVVTTNNDLVLMGTTGSSDFPTTSGAFSRIFYGGSLVVYDNVIAFPDGVDIYVLKLSEDGQHLLGSTYVGGNDNDGLNYKQYYNYNDPVTGYNYVKQHGNDSLYFSYGDGARGEVIVDDQNMIYVGTNTFSLNFPYGINQGYQSINRGGQDGVVFKMSADLTQMLWSSYLGGNEDDAIFSICLDGLGDVLVTGGTVSRDFPTTTGAYNEDHNGGSTDAFIAKLNPDGNILIASTYFGSDRYDNAYFVRTDKANNIFICGQTKAPGNTLIYNAGYSVPNSGQFITKFNSQLSTVLWSTVFGSGNGRPNIALTAFAVDVCNRIYLSGWGREWVNSYYNNNWNYYTWNSQFGTKGMEVTPDALQSTTDGQDFYILVLDEDARNLEYATFFGETHLDGSSCYATGRDHVDGGTARFDHKGHIIQSVCGSCSSGSCQNFPTTEGAWATRNAAINCNDAVFKIRIIENLATASFEPIPVGCVPYEVQFVNHSQGTSYYWDFGDGTTSILYNPSHIYTSGGEYNVRLVVNDPTSCNINDTLFRTIRVVEPGTSNLPDITICPGESVIIGPSIEYDRETSFMWYGNDLSNNGIKNPLATPTSTTRYMLVASGICNDTIYQNVIVNRPEINLIASNDTLICKGGSAYLYASSTSNIVSWEWSDNSNFSNIISNSHVVSVSPSNSTVYYVRATEGECNTNRVESVSVNLHRFLFTLEPIQYVCVGGTTNLTVTNNNISDQLTYSWEPLLYIVSGANTNSPLVNPVEPTVFTVTITNQMGCTITSNVLVNIDDIVFTEPLLTHNLCYGDCAASARVSANGIAPYSFSWSNNQTGETVNGLCSGEYTVTVTDVIGCTAESNISITSPPQLLGDFINIVEPQCDGIGYGSVTVDPSGGTPGYYYQWSFGGGNSATNNECFAGINIVTITDANNCIFIDSIDLPAPSDLISSISSFNMVSCYGGCDGSISVNVQNGREPYSYYWSNGVNSSQIFDLCVGNYVVTVIDYDNCVTHKFMEITQPDSLVAEIFVKSVILCNGGIGGIGVDVEGGVTDYSYLWSNGSAEEYIYNISAGHYEVTIVDANGCEIIKGIELTEPSELSLDSYYKNMLCDDNCNGMISVDISGGTYPYFYSWSNGETRNELNNLCAGDYELYVNDNNNCIITERFVIINEEFVPDLSIDASSTHIYEGQSIKLTAKSSYPGNYIWNNEKYLNDYKISDPIATPLEDVLFRVNFYDANGCRNTDTIRIKVDKVICKDPYIFIPTAFTPNDDGNNDYFKPYHPNSLITSLYFSIHDRWGNLMYETNRINDKGWDGTYKGEKLAPDVYVFYFKARCLNGEEYTKKGNVTLLR